MLLIIDPVTGLPLTDDELENSGISITFSPIVKHPEIPEDCWIVGNNYVVQSTLDEPAMFADYCGNKKWKFPLGAHTKWFTGIPISVTKGCDTEPNYF